MAITPPLRRGLLAGLAAALTVPLGLLAAPAQADTFPIGSCTTADKTITVYNFNDFHGHVETAAALFTPVETTRKAVAGDPNQGVLLLSAGDSVGASPFVSSVADDQPTLDILNLAKVDASAVGNHEFDRGFSDLKNRISTSAQFPYLGANVYDRASGKPALPEYTILNRAGVKVAVVGVVTGGLSGLVSPDGISTLTIKDPVTELNRVAAQLSDGNAANGEADVIIAEIHEGGPEGATSAAAGAKESPAFNTIYSGVNPHVAAVMTAHTHQTYNWTTTTGRPLTQAGSYGSHLTKLVIKVDSAKGEVCDLASTVSPIDPKVSDTSLPVIKQISDAYAKAKADASVKGAVVIGQADAPLTRGLDSAGAPGARNNESTLSNTIADMFKDTLSNGDPNFIGLQNPGGTRADLSAGDITYEQAANVLPFANTLKTTQITGAQFKTVLEQQWQRLADGSVPPRPYLQLGVSSNVTYTYDESLPEGSRITGIHVNGKPIDPAAKYTVGSGSFLIAGGDQFWELAKGTNTRDTGHSDLTAWVDWIKAKGVVSPDYAKRGVSVKGAPTTLTAGQASAPFAVGVPVEGALAPDTLHLNSTGTPATTELQAFIVQAGGNAGRARAITAAPQGVQVGTATVTDGQVSAMSVTVPTDAPLVSGPAQLVLYSPQTGTTVTLEVTLAMGETPTPTPTPSPSVTPPVTPPPSSSTPTPTAGPSEPTTPPTKPGLPNTGR